MPYYKDTNNHVYYEDKNGVVHKTNLIAHSDNKTKSFGSKSSHREYSSKKKNPESRNNNSRKFSIKNLLFGLSASLYLLAYFFLGAVPESILKTRVDTTITNNINGVDYDYNVSYSDYDYTKKIEQLSDFENIFDFGLISSANTNLIQYGVDEWDVADYPSIAVALIHEDIVVRQYDYINVDNSVITINYLDWSFAYDVVIFLTPGFSDELKDFVNKRNFKDYANLKYGINVASNVSDQVTYYLYRVFIFLSGPIDWLGNFMYDLGVLARFIFIW